MSLDRDAKFKKLNRGHQRQMLKQDLQVPLAGQEEGFSRAGLSLLGFKPASCLKPWHTWRQSNFVYPDERTMPGSTTAFIALHEAMLTQDRVALCTYVRSRNTEPRLVALMAAQEVKDEYGEQVSLGATTATLRGSAELQQVHQAVALMLLRRVSWSPPWGIRKGEEC